MPNDNSLSEDAQPENQEDEGSEPGSAAFHCESMSLFYR